MQALHCAALLLDVAGCLAAQGSRLLTVPPPAWAHAAQISGAIIAPVALLFMAYSLFMYKKRTIQVGVKWV